MFEEILCMSLKKREQKQEELIDISILFNLLSSVSSVSMVVMRFNKNEPLHTDHILHLCSMFRVSFDPMTLKKCLYQI